MERKPRTRRQAQVEEFAHARVRELSEEQGLFLKYSDELSRQIISSPEDIPEEFPEELKRAIQNYWDSYVHFLRDLQAEDRLAIKVAERNADYYEQKFSGPVKRLKRAVQKEGKKSHGFIGEGSNGAAYALVVDGHEYVVKLGGSATQTNFDVRALIRAKGIPKVAQIVVYSFEDHAQVMERMPGKDVTQSSEEELSALKDRQIAELIQTVQQLANRGLVIDPKPSNFMYDKDEGFGVLDYHIAYPGSERVAAQIMSLRLALSTKQTDFQWPKADDPQAEKKEEKHAVEMQRFYLPRLIRFVMVLQEQFPEVIQQWKRLRKQMLANPNIGGGHFLRKGDFKLSNPGVAGYVAQLEELDDGWIFL